MSYISDAVIETQCVNTLGLSVFSLVILCIIAYRMYRNEDRQSLQARLFMLLIRLNGILLIVDGLSVGMDGLTGRAGRIILELLSAAYLLAQTVITYVWACFVIEVTGTKKCSAKLPHVVFALPIFFVVLILCATPFFNTGFMYTAANHYRRTAGTYLIIVIDFVYLLLSYAIVFRSRRRIGRKKSAVLLSLALPPAAAGVLQIFFPFLGFIWPSLTVSLLINYLTIQNEQVLLDHLTGVNNRRSLDIALKRKMNGNQRSGVFGLLLIDLDKFKSINDNYGHLEGDNALEATAQILRKCFHHNDFIARYGGDEFLVIIDLQDKNDITAIEKRLQAQVAAWNGTSGKPWKIEFSIGSISYPPDAEISPEECLREIDLLLYGQKKTKCAEQA